MTSHAKNTNVILKNFYHFVPKDLEVLNRDDREKNCKIKRLVFLNNLT